MKVLKCSEAKLGIYNCRRNGYRIHVLSITRPDPNVLWDRGNITYKYLPLLDGKEYDVTVDCVKVNTYSFQSMNDTFLTYGDDAILEYTPNEKKKILIKDLLCQV